MADEEEVIGSPEEEQVSSSGWREGVALIFGYLWGWVVVGAVFAILVGFAASAVYGEDFGLAAFLFAISIFLLVVKGLTWEVLHAHRDKMWASLVIVVLGVVCLAGCEYWVHYESTKSKSKTEATRNPADTKPSAQHSTATDQSRERQSIPDEKLSHKDSLPKTSAKLKTSAKDPAKIVPVSPTKEQDCHNSICNQDSSVLAPQTVTNNFGEKTPTFLDIQLITKDSQGFDYPIKNPKGNPLASVKFYADGPWDNPRVEVVCDRPCAPNEAQPFKRGILMSPSFNGFAESDNPSVIIFEFTTIKPMAADTYYVLTVASRDSDPIQILRVLPYVGRLPPH